MGILLTRRDVGDKLQFEVGADRHLWIHIYEGFSHRTSGSPKFSVTVRIASKDSLAALPELLPAVKTKGDDSFYLTASSYYRPEVVPVGMSPTQLVQQLLELDARNLSRDCIFGGRPLVLTVQPYDYENRRRCGRDVELLQVKLL